MNTYYDHLTYISINPIQYDIMLPIIQTTYLHLSLALMLYVQANILQAHPKVHSQQAKILNIQL